MEPFQWSFFCIKKKCPEINPKLSLAKLSSQWFFSVKISLNNVQSRVFSVFRDINIYYTCFYWGKKCMVATSMMREFNNLCLFYTFANHIFVSISAIGLLFPAAHIYVWLQKCVRNLTCILYLMYFQHNFTIAYLMKMQNMSLIWLCVVWCGV